MNEEYQKMNGSAKDNRVKVVLGNLKLWVHFLEFEYEPTIETFFTFQEPNGVTKVKASWSICWQKTQMWSLGVR